MSTSAATSALKDSIKSLISTIEAQSEFSQQQTQRKGKVYFMWDFVTNTLRMLESPSANQPETKSDVMQRCMFANILFNDTTGKMAAMCGGDNTDFSADVKRQSADCEQKAGDWAVAEGVMGP